MGQWQHGGGFSVDGSVRIGATDCVGRERLLRYCARPAFALDRPRALDREDLIYDHPKRRPGGSGPQLLTLLELLDRLATPVPPPTVRRASAATATSAHSCERTLAGNFRGDLDRLKLAGRGRSREVRVRFAR